MKQKKTYLYNSNILPRRNEKKIKREEIKEIKAKEGIRNT